jgi:putative ABC transport system permease protein
VKPGGRRRVERIALHFYRALLLLLPAALRREQREEMEALFARLVSEVWRVRGGLAAAGVVVRSAADVIGCAVVSRLSRRGRGFDRSVAEPRDRTDRMDTMLVDVKQAARALVKRPSLTILAVLTFALGIGANAAIFSVVRGVLLRELPYDSPDRVVRLQGTRSGEVNVSGTLSYPNVRDVAARTRSFESVAAYDEWRPTLTRAGEASLVDGALVNVEFFDVLGVRPFAGRFFIAEEDIDGRDRVVVLSHGFWRARFGGDARVVGTAVELNGNAHTIVGIAPADFEDPRLGGARFGEPQVWRPLGMNGLPDGEGPSRSGSSYTAVARLETGVGIAAANAELASLSRALEAEYPEANREVGMTAVSLRESIVGDVRGSLLLLLGAVGFLLAIAAANVGSLLLGRATERRQEVALRFALGASRARVVRLILGETLLLAAAGGAAGIALAALATRTLLRLGTEFIPRGANVGIDAAVVLFALVVTAVTGILCGLVPALLASRADLRSAIGESGRGASQSRGTARLRRTLVAVEVALALVLLAGAGLLGRSLFRLMRVDVGIETRDLLTFTVSPGVAHYPDNGAVAALHDELSARLRALPGVRAAATTNVLPLSGGFDCTTVRLPGLAQEDAAERVCPQVRSVSPSWFGTVGLDLRAGRLLEERDRSGSPAVAVAGAALAQTLFPGEDPIGRRVQIADTLVEIVGVVDDVKHLRLEEPAPPALYLARSQEIIGWHPRQMTFVLRTGVEPFDVLPAVRATVRDIDPLLPLANVRTLDDLVERSSAPPRFRTVLLGSFAGLALLLAGVGIYGVVSFSVATRTREVAIRMAVGGRAAEVRRLVVLQALAPVALGIAAGMAGALAGSRVLEAVLFQVDATDPLIFAAVPVVLATVAIAAALPPALRLTRGDPMAALRDD